MPFQLFSPLFDCRAASAMVCLCCYWDEASSGLDHCSHALSCLSRLMPQACLTIFCICTPTCWPPTCWVEGCEPCTAWIFVTCASKPLSGTDHSKTSGAKARRDLSCTKGVKRRHSELEARKGDLQCNCRAVSCALVDISCRRSRLQCNCRAPSPAGT